MSSRWRTFRNQFNRLRWKLTISYFTVTVIALLMAELIAILGVSALIVREARVTKEEIISELTSQEFAGLDDRRLVEKLGLNRLDISLGGYINIGSSFLSSTPPNISGLKEFISGFSANVVDIKPIEIGNFIINVSNTNFLTIYYTDADGKLIGSIPPDISQKAAIGESFNPDVFPGLTEPYQAAVAGSRVYDKLITRIDENVLVGMVPIPDDNQPEETVGYLAFEHKSRLTEILQWQELSRQLGLSLIAITGMAGVFGIFFGFLTAKSITSRLDRVTEAAHSWSQGDFSVLVDDPNPDELGRLGKTLNHMAMRMENLLEERQEISVMEERNRLARELHDSVKQQTFAASAQLAAARSRLNQPPEKAEENLREAENLIDSVRQELTDLIHELGPATLKGKGLARAVRSYALECETQMSIPVITRIQGEKTIPLEVEQTLFRVIQGAMANVARHSQAARAEIRLVYERDQVTVSIEDDGVGFNLDQLSFGFGLKSIQERVEIIHGEMEIISSPGRGTTLIIRAPI